MKKKRPLRPSARLFYSCIRLVFLRVSPPPFSPGASGFCISVWKRGGGIARKEKGLSRIEKKKGGPETTPPRKSDRKKKWKKAFSFFIRQERKSFPP